MATYYVRPDGNDANTGLGDSAALAWKTAKYGMQFASNGVIANNDTLWLAADQGNYTENAIVIDRGIVVRGLRGIAVIDGTGGAAGSDIVTHGVAALFIDVKVQNAVDKGFAWTASIAKFRNVGALTCGGDGFYRTHGNHTADYCYARANGGAGFNEDSAGLDHDHFACESGDNTGRGFVLGTATSVLFRCLSYDNGTDGIYHLNTPGAGGGIVGCTSEGNGGDGFECQGTPSDGFFFQNNILSNNGGFGAKAVGTGTQKSDYNDFYNNTSGARSNWPTGSNDLAVDPGFVSPGTDDYTLDTGSAMILAGLCGWKSPNKVSIGATEAEAASAGGGGGGGYVRI